MGSKDAYTCMPLFINKYSICTFTHTGACRQRSSVKMRSTTCTSMHALKWRWRVLRMAWRWVAFITQEIRSCKNPSAIHMVVPASIMPILFHLPTPSITKSGLPSNYSCYCHSVPIMHHPCCRFRCCTVASSAGRLPQHVSTVSHHAHTPSSQSGCYR